MYRDLPHVLSLQKQIRQRSDILPEVYMQALHRIVVINLAHRKDRWNETMRELYALGVPRQRIVRLDATKATPGYLGCAHSHLRALLLAREKRWPTVSIIEDDFKAAVGAKEMALRLEKFSAEVKEFDVLMLAHKCSSRFPFGKPRARRRWPSGRGGVVRAEGNAQTTAAYVVHERFYDALIENRIRGLNEARSCNQGGDGGRYACDQFWKSLQTTSEWFLAEPRLATQRPSYSDIEGAWRDYGV